MAQFEEVGTIRSHRNFLLQRLMVLRGPWRLEDAKVVEATGAGALNPGIWLVGDHVEHTEFVSALDTHDTDALLTYYRTVESETFERKCVVKGATLGHGRGEKIINYPAMPTKAA
jgi:hypothetical protein